MAEINIEEKNKGNNKNSKNNKGLYIIIAILVIAALIWWISSGDDENENEIIRPTTMEQPMPEKPESQTPGNSKILELDALASL